MNYLHFDGPLLEATYDQLYQQTVSAFPKTHKRQHVVGDVRVQKLQYVPYPEAGRLGINSVTKTTNGDMHQQRMVIEGVDFDANGTAQVVGSVGRPVPLVPINLFDSNCKVNCNCMDFYWRFATWNAGDGALDGKAPPPYVKKTDRPPVNPSQSPGLCKHLIAVFDRMEQDGIAT